MEDSFNIPVTYKGKDYLFPAQLLVAGFSYKIQVDVLGNMIAYEPDEERNFRAVISWDDLHQQAHFDKQLLQEIARAIEAIVK